MTGKRRKSKHSRRDVGKVDTVATATGGPRRGTDRPHSHGERHGADGRSYLDGSDECDGKVPAGEEG